MASSFSSRFFFSTTLILLLLCNISTAKDFLVGGSSDAWKVPASSLDSLNRWAEANRFQVGDSLVWKYDGKKDSVLQVTRDGYFSCNTTGPMFECDEGSTTVKLDRAGAYYFISGGEGKCEKGEKVIVVVMSNKRRSMGFSLPPAPSPSEEPAMAPVAGGAVGLMMSMGGGCTGGVVLLLVMGIIGWLVGLDI